MKDPRAEFAKWIPVYTYDRMQREWWHRSRNDQHQYHLAGIVPYYGLSSGTTQASTNIYRSRRRVFLHGIKFQKIFLTSSGFINVNAHILSKQSLMVGGSESLIKEGKHFIGDNSGIMARHRPFGSVLYIVLKVVFNYCLNGKKGCKPSSIMLHNGILLFMVGNIAWIQLICEKVMQQYGLHSIQEIWPHLTLLINSGITSIHTYPL